MANNRKFKDTPAGRYYVDSYKCVYTHQVNKNWAEKLVEIRKKLHSFRQSLLNLHLDIDTDLLYSINKKKRKSTAKTTTTAAATTTATTIKGKIWRILMYS